MAEIEGQDPQLNVKRMSCEEFKFVIKDKGWLMKNVAERWKLGTVRMSQICSDEERPLYYDDAVRALPRKKNVKS